MVLALVLLLSLETAGLSPPNQEVVPVPNVENFSIDLSKELEFGIDDCKIGFVGRVVVYQNPHNPNEFVKVYYRQMAIISERACENNGAETNGLGGDSSNLNYHQKEEADTLSRAQKATDAFAFVQWRITKDLRTGYDIQDGPMQNWILDSDGIYVYFSQPEGVEENALKSSPFSEPSKADSDKRIIVGIKFSLAGAVHIVRIDQDDIQNMVKEVADDKK